MTRRRGQQRLHQHHHRHQLRSPHMSVPGVAQPHTMRVVVAVRANTQCPGDDPVHTTTPTHPDPQTLTSWSHLPKQIVQRHQWRQHLLAHHVCRHHASGKDAALCGADLPSHNAGTASVHIFSISHSHPRCPPPLTTLLLSCLCRAPSAPADTTTSFVTISSSFRAFQPHAHK